MPCDLGYKNFTSVTIPVPKPLAFKKKTVAPKVDAELMERIGQDDPDFIEWMNELDTAALLELALAKARPAIGGKMPVEFTVSAGGLSATATYKNDAEKAQVEEIADRVGRRWQMEVLAIVAQLLDFETTITVTKVGGQEVITLEGEKHGDEQVHEYLRVTLDPARGSSVLFEHFASEKKLALVKAKFQALAERFGVKLKMGETRESGSPIPGGAVHKHFLRRGGK